MNLPSDLPDWMGELLTSVVEQAKMRFHQAKTSDEMWASQGFSKAVDSICIEIESRAAEEISKARKLAGRLENGRRDPDDYAQ